MLGIENEICKIAMSYEIIDFKNIVIKPYFKNETEKNAKNVTNEKNIDHENEISKNASSEKISINANSEKKFQINIGSEEISQSQIKKTSFSNSFSTRNRDRPKKLPMKYKNDETDISIFLQNDSQNDQLLQPASFVKSRKNKINDFFEKKLF